MPFAPEKIRNVAFVGHRGSGKTSLAEALLFQAGAVTRLGSVADGSTVSDHDDDEKRRTMSISGSLLHAEHEGHKLNIFDAPGDPSFVADALSALRVVEGALFTVSGVAGVEVMTSRLWRRCDELEQSRVVFINHLDRDRADFAAALESIQQQLSPRCVAIAIPIGGEKDFRGVIDVLHMVAYEDAGDGSREAEPGPIPADMVDEAATWRERLVEAVVEVSDDLTVKYLDGEEITADELREALHAEVLRGELFPVACGSATKNEGTHALLDLIVEGVPAPSENFIAAAPATRTWCSRRTRAPLRSTPSRRWRTPTSAGSTSCASSRAHCTPTCSSSTAARGPRSASARCWRCRARSTTRSPSSARATSAPCPS